MLQVSRSKLFGVSLSLSLLTLSLMIGLLALPSPARGQVAIAEISGTVTDQSGAAVPNATVRMVETEKQAVHSTASDSGGRYVLPNLPVGPYRLEAKAAGFKDYVQTGIVLQVGQHIQQNITLTVGSVSETVEVHAAVSMVETTQNGVAQVIDTRSITDLPLNGRQATQLVLLSGASVQPPGGNSMTGSKNYSSSTTISVGGGQVNGTAYLLDGGEHTDTMTNVNLPFPFPDALQEFSVETSALSAKFGTHPGATVNAVTKSGTNSLHGTLFEFLRNGNTNARNYFALIHDSLKRNTFGGTIGGKLIKDKLFYFGGYQGLRNRSQPPVITNTIPNAAVLTGDFSGVVAAGCPQAKANLAGQNGALLDPLTGRAFPNNIIPTARLNPASVKLASGYLPTSQADGCGRVLFGIPQTGDENQFISRVDYIQNSKHSIYSRYFSAGYSNPPVFDGKSLLTTTTSGNFERVQTATIGDTYSIGPSTLNSAHITFARRRDDRGPAANQIGPNDIGINMFQKVPNFLLVTVTNFFSVGCGTCAPGHFNVNTWTLGDDLDLVRGRHHIAIGVNFIRTQNNLISGFNENGTFTFNTDTNGASTAVASAGYPLADFMLGRVNGLNQSNPTPDDLRQTILSAYVQDTFKFSPRLTLNAGVRWEPLYPNNDKYLRGTYFDRAAFDAGTVSKVYPNAPPGTFFPNENGYGKSIWKQHVMNFGPRLGMVWNPHGDGRDSFRIGTAIIYDTTELFFDERKTTNPPYGSSVQLNSGITSASAPTVGPFNNPYANYPGGSPFPAPNLFPLGGVYIQMPLDTKPTYLVQWNASYQRQFGSWLASVTYMGNKTTHLWVGSEINPSVYIPGSSASTQARRILNLANAAKGQYYASINQADEGANAHYNALLLSLQHRFSHGFTLLTNYTHSSCISDLDFTGELGGSPGSQPFNRHAEEGSCNFDVKRIFNLSLVAKSTVRGSNTFVNRLLSDWQFAPIVRAISGFPFSVTSGTDNSRTGLADRPNLVQSNAYQATAVCPSNAPCLSYLTAAATGFAQNPLGTFGNLGRNAFRGPGALNIDVTLSRAFRIKERYTLEARFDAFNVINRANFSNPASNLNSPASFGLITSTQGAPSASLLLPAVGDPRILQFALKIKF